MADVWFAGDAHFGHKRIAHFRKEFSSQEEHDAMIVSSWIANIGKRDLVYCMGDFAFTQAGLEMFEALPGRKILIRGNHDKLKAMEYLAFCEDVHGITRYKKAWLSHCPIHPDELWGKFNIHGHVHGNTVRDINYVNVCFENIGYAPIRYRDILAWREEGDVDIPLERFNTAEKFFEAAWKGPSG